MLKLLIKSFIKDSDNVHDPKVRSAYGTLCGLYGIFLNIVLFAGKLFAGKLSGSVAITADAFNNLSDAGSSVISLLGFALANKKPDPGHPFGHGRIEYITGLVISALIIIMGVELGQSSINKIIHPEPVSAGLLPALILVASILIKFYMSLYNRKIGEKINSSAMLATATDSLSDSVSTAVVLLSMVIAWIFNINIDGWAGLAVAVFICYAGISAARETLSPLLGQAPNPELVKGIEKTALAHSEVKGIHDLLVHDYGPGRQIASLHAEVDGSGDFFEAHDAIDRIEAEIKEKYGCLTTIHLDPIESDNSEVSRLRSLVSDEIKAEMGQDVTIHDFRMVPGKTHTNVIFDTVLPADYKMSDDEAAEKVRSIVSEKHPSHNAVVNIDRSFV